MADRTDAWASRTYLPEDELQWTAWIEGYFQHSNISSEQASERIWVRNFQENYTRDKTLMALGDVRGQKGLDVGGGAADYSILLALQGVSMSTQDLSADAVARGRDHAERLGVDIEFSVGDAQSLNYPDASFDFCIATDFFEHITEEQKSNVIGEMYRVLKPGGLVVIKTPNLTYLKISTWIRRVGLLLRGRSPIVFIAHTRDNPDREHHGLINFRGLEAIVREHFFLEIERIPLSLRRRRLPNWVTRLVRGVWPLTEHIVLRFRKSIVVPIGDDLNRQAREG